MINEKFGKFFAGMFPESEVFCPYRICPIGAHVDHQFGKVLGFALNRGINLYYKAIEKPVLKIYSSNFDNLITVKLKKDIRIKNNWSDYVQAAINALLDQGYKLRNGFYGVIMGDLPIGGLASSSAVLLVYLTALSKINKIYLERNELVRLAYLAEHKFMNLNIGMLDQSCEIYCKEGNLLYLDTLNNYMENLVAKENMPSFCICIIYTGISRTLRNTVYNIRVAECKEAASVLKRYSGILSTSITESYLREVPKEIFEHYKKELPKNLRKRAEHYFSEEMRLEKGITAWRKGNIDEFGQLIFESGDSSIENYECGCLEFRKLHSIAKEIPEIWGGRFSGAGFKGCYMAIVNSDCTEQIEEIVTEKYLEAFPELKGKFSIHFCNTADGLKALE